jgi:protocatechuate 3,4-dioxygenase beta subunit
MVRRSHLLLSAVGVALALGVVWLARGVATEKPSTSSSRVADAQADAARRDASVELTSPSIRSRADEIARVSAGSVHSESNAPANTDFSTDELANAKWIEGRVVFPAGTPAGEHAEVVANSFRKDSSYRAAVKADGTFRVAFSNNTRRGDLRVEGRWLYSKEPLTLNLSKPPSDIVLEPLLGGCIHGRFVLPKNALAAAPELHDTHVEFHMCTTPRTEVGEFAGLVVIDDKLEFEIGHRCADTCWNLRSSPIGFVAVERKELRVKAGAIENIEIELQSGARIAGHVQDESGAPIEGVEFAVRFDMPFAANVVRTRDGHNAEDGSFDCFGLPLGALKLQASKEGFVPASFDAGEMHEGDVRRDVVLVLRRGNGVKGRVTWPDGKPVAGGRVELHHVVDDATHRDEHERDRHVQTRHDGSFEFTGLTQGSFIVTALAVPDSEPTSAAGHASDAANEKRSPDADDDEWSARIEGVQPSDTVLALVLQKGKAIDGRVVDDLGRPIESFAIAIASVDELGKASGSFDSKSFRDPRGVFWRSGLHDGRWRVSARANGYARPAPRTVRVPMEERLGDLVLPRAATLSGTVADADGRPVAKATLRIDRVPKASGQFDDNTDVDPITDKEGRFECHDLAPGSIQLVASADGRADSVPMVLTLEAGQSLTGLTLALSAGGRLVGEVFDAAGQPDAHRSISVVRRGGSASHREIGADELGRFAVEHLAAGTYDVYTRESAKEREENRRANAHVVSQREARAIIVDGETTHVSIGAPPSSPVRVHGVVTSARHALPGVEMNVGRVLTNGERVDHSMASDAEGRYEITLDEPGDWGFFFNLPSGTSSGRHENIPAGASYELDIALPSGSISGRVVDSSDHPIAGIDVEARTDPATAELSSIAASGSATTDANGRFQFDALPDGTYALDTFEMSSPDSGAVSLRYAHVHKSGLVLHGGSDLRDVELRLSPSASLEGTELDPSGSPVRFARVFVRDRLGAQTRLPFAALTDAKGRFKAEGLSPGTFTVFARTESSCSSESNPLTVRSDGASEVELMLQPSASVRVIIEDEHGTKIGSMISVVDARGRDFGPMSPATPDDMSGEGLSAGRTFGPLPPGQYSVSATNHDKVSVGASVALAAGAQEVVTLRFGK